MKLRILCLILVFCFLLSGCSFFGERIREPVTFYYLCKNYQENLCCVLTPEEREASGHTGDLPYLLALYLMGPTDDEHMSPLPSETHITSSFEGETIILTLSDTASLSDIDYSLACACLTMTCLDMSDAEKVIIRSGDREKVMTRNSLTLYDAISESIPTEET